MSRTSPSTAHAGHRTTIARRLLLSLCLTAPVLLTATAPAAASRPAALHLSGPARVSVGTPFRIDLSVRDSVDLAGFETTLLFDQSAAHFGGVRQLRNDLRHAGRGVRPLGHEEVAGGVSFGFYSCPVRDCVTRSRPSGAIGARSDTRVATVEMTADRAGILELRLAGSRFVDALGRPLAVADADVTVRIQVGTSPTMHSAPALAWHSPAIAPRGPARLFDLDRNGVVTNSDAMTAAYAWTMAHIANDPCGAAVPHDADVDGDGCLTVSDLQSLASRFSPQGATATWAPRRTQTLRAVPSAAPALPAGSVPGSGVTYTVNNAADTVDSSPGDGICATAAGVCTLRAAVEEANRTFGGATVAFAIAGDDPTKTITLIDKLPIINNESGPVVIDGYTQSGSSVNTAPRASNAVIRIEITGPGESVAFPALYITSADNTIRGIAVFGLWRDIWLDGPGAHDNVLVGNFIGTNAAATYNTPEWNHANGAVVLSDGPVHTHIGRPVIADRNVISGGPATGVYHTHEGTEENFTQNNIIGLSPDGKRRLPNKLEGVDYNFGASNNLDGGTGPLERNVQSGNSATGAETSHGTNTLGNRFIGNFVGTNLKGTRAYAYTANHNYGIHIEDGSGDSVVSDNVIAGNLESGVRIDGIGTLNTLVTRNRIGITLDGTPAGNANSGIRIIYHATQGTISENIIAFNPRGIDLRDPDDDFFTITRNSIYGNTTKGELGLGIDLLPRQGVNPNDGDDADSGANDGLNYPVIGSATTSSVSGTACASCIVEIFLADRKVGAYGSGKTFVGSATAGGDGAFSVPVSGVTVGAALTATATDPQGNTSEFSRNVAAGSATAAATQP